jgi:hypothetical protein
MPGNCYSTQDLSQFGEIGRNTRDLARKSVEWYNAVFLDGARWARDALIALAVPCCLGGYAKDALEKGNNLDRMTEAVHIAAAIRARRSDAPTRCDTSTDGRALDSCS